MPNFTTSIVPEPEWEGLLKELIKHRGTALLVGASDSGKSTLARYLIRELISENIKVSFVDSDIGQSSLGLPGTISMKTFSSALRRTEDLEEFVPEKIFFVGTFNPSRKIHLIIDGVKRMVDLSKAKSDVILIDTTGLISGNVGIALKIGKIKAIRPEHIIALQRHEEVEHILNLLEDMNPAPTCSGRVHIYRLRPSPMAKSRSRDARIRYRKERFDEYFDGRKLSEFLLNDINLFYNGKPCMNQKRFIPFRPKEMDFKEGALIGLNHNEDTKALGILSELDDTSITFKSPISSVRGINRIILGDINLYESGAREGS